MADGDVGCAAWADGVADKGEIPFVPSFARLWSANMSCFWVGGEVAYASESFMGGDVYSLFKDGGADYTSARWRNTGWNMSIYG